MRVPFVLGIAWKCTKFSFAQNLANCQIFCTLCSFRGHSEPILSDTFKKSTNSDSSLNLPSGKWFSFLLTHPSAQERKGMPDRLKRHFHKSRKTLPNFAALYLRNEKSQKNAPVIATFSVLCSTQQVYCNALNNFFSQFPQRICILRQIYKTSFQNFDFGRINFQCRRNLMSNSDSLAHFSLEYKFFLFSYHCWLRNSNIPKM